MRTNTDIEKNYLLPREEIILKSQGGYRQSWRGGCRTGHLCLTNQRLMVFQLQGVLLELPLTLISDICVEKQPFVLGKKPALAVSYKSSENTGKVWFFIKELNIWQQAIFERCLLKVDESQATEIALSLSPPSQNIFWYLWHQGHANIQELAEASNFCSHWEVVQRIHEEINPTAQKSVGGSILFFEKFRIHPETEEKILFHWWFLGREIKREPQETLIDVFDEGDHLRIIFEFLGVDEREIDLKLQKKHLIVRAGRGYQKVLSLPAKINLEKEPSQRYNNGVFEVKLTKIAG